jgi:uncharacterized NAD(P)/FAD-binding protein YdhS
MAPQIADIIDAERRAGSLEVRDGHVTTVATSGKGLCVTARGGRESFAVAAAHVINCTGPSLNYRAAGSTLLRAMLEAGDIVPGFAGAGLRCTPDGALFNCAGEVAAGLFAIGPSRLGVLFESIAIPEIRQQARDLASLLANQLEARGIAA